MLNSEITHHVEAIMGTVSISPAVAALREGRIVGIPTDTVYGIGVDPWNPAAVESLYRLKGRALDKPISLMLGAATEAASLGSLSVVALDLVRRFWPGPLTVVVRRNPSLPRWVGDAVTSTVGLRVPNHEPLLELLEATGPLAVTSANRAGGPPSMDDLEARAIFGDEVAVYVAGRCPGGVASTVVDATRDELRVLREGPVAIG